MKLKQIKYELQHLVSGKSSASYDALIQTVTSYLASGKRTGPMAKGKHENKTKETEKLISFANQNNLFLPAPPEDRFISSGA